MSSLCKNNPVCTGRTPSMHTMALMLSVLAVPVAAEVAIPEGCAPVATAHKNSCKVHVIFECATGYQAHLYDHGRWHSSFHYDANWEMQLYVLEERGRGEMKRSESNRSNAMLPDLLRDGATVNSGEYIANSGAIRDRSYQLSGEVVLSDEVVSFGGEDFRTGTMTRLFEIKQGSGGMEFSFDLLVSESRDLIIETLAARSIMGSPAEALDESVRKIAFDGDAGFLEPMSEFGCG